jgi:hypothetical protein
VTGCLLCPRTTIVAVAVFTPTTEATRDAVLTLTRRPGATITYGLCADHAHEVISNPNRIAAAVEAAVLSLAADLRVTH